MNKGKIIAISAGILIFVFVIWAGLLFTFSNKPNTKDSFSTDVTYKDTSRKIPIALDLTYSTSHEKDFKYPLNTDKSDKALISYSASIDKGTAFIIIEKGSTQISKYQIGKKNKFAIQLDPKASYIISVKVNNGKGNIHLDWTEMS